MIVRWSVWMISHECYHFFISADISWTGSSPEGVKQKAVSCILDKGWSYGSELLQILDWWCSAYGSFPGPCRQIVWPLKPKLFPSSDEWSTCHLSVFFQLGRQHSNPRQNTSDWWWCHRVGPSDVMRWPTFVRFIVVHVIVLSCPSLRELWE